MAVSLQAGERAAIHHPQLAGQRGLFCMGEWETLHGVNGSGAKW